MFFGGSRGGGKTNGIIGKYGLKCNMSRYVNAIFFRKEMPQADDLIEEAKEIYCRIGAIWRDQKKLFEFGNGSRVRFRPLETEKDAEKFQGQNLTDCACEEIGNYEGTEDNKPPPAIFKLFGAMRSKHGIPTQLILTANPGGVGQSWIRERYIDPAPSGMVPLIEKTPDGKIHKRIYIPSRVFDNKILLLRNPNYISNLHRVGSKQLVNAWLYGLWDQIIGAFFSEFNSDKHIIPPFKIPKRWRRILGYDWGHHSPACAVWGAVSDGKDDEGREVYTSDGRHIPKGAVVLYREKSWRQVPNEQMAKEILELSAGETIDTKVADPSIFNSQGGESIGDQFQKCGLYFQRADNDRASGWAQFRKRMQPTLNDSSPPLLYLFSSMTYGIRTLPSAPICPRNAEDIDTKSDDHWLDAARYLLKEVQITDTEYKAPVVQATKGVIHLNKLLETHKRDKKKRKL